VIIFEKEFLNGLKISNLEVSTFLMATASFLFPVPAGQPRTLQNAQSSTESLCVADRIVL
jgi:hypothetical protein